jgi:hypothetical protein
MLQPLNDTTSERVATRSYESPVIRTHKREELETNATPINACTSFDPIGE